MPSALVATVGGATSNTYVTRDEANTYFGDRIDGDDWTSAANDTKDRALLTAAKRIDLEKYEGEKTDTDQALQWPRLYVFDEVVDPDEELPSDEIPEKVKRAQMELAFAYITGSVAPTPTGADEFKRITIGRFTVEPNQSTTETPQGTQDMPDLVKRLLKPFLVLPGRVPRA